MLRRALLLGAVLTTAAACAPTAPDTAADEARLRTDAPVWFDLYNRGDADGVANLYAEDGVILPPGSPAITGRAAIRNFLVDDIAVARAEGIRITSGDVTGVGVSGNLAWVSGAFSITDNAGAAIDTGKYVSVYRRTDSGWELIRDAWNLNSVPAATAPAPAAAAPAPAAPADTAPAPAAPASPTT